MLWILGILKFNKLWVVNSLHPVYKRQNAQANDTSGGRRRAAEAVGGVKMTGIYRHNGYQGTSSPHI